MSKVSIFKTIREMDAPELQKFANELTAKEPTKEHSAQLEMCAKQYFELTGEVLTNKL